jgi:hypothetical protein
MPSLAPNRLHMVTSPPQIPIGAHPAISEPSISDSDFTTSHSTTFPTPTPASASSSFPQTLSSAPLRAQIRSRVPAIMREYGKQQRGRNSIHVLPINQGKSATLRRSSLPQGHSAEQTFDKTPNSTLDDPSLNPHLLKYVVCRV